VLRSSHRPARAPAIDLDTIRETVSYMHDDVARVQELERLAAAFRSVLKELDAVGQPAAADAPARVMAARFIPFRR
jgi:hypothetical protein